METQLWSQKQNRPYTEEQALRQVYGAQVLLTDTEGNILHSVDCHKACPLNKYRSVAGG